MLKLVAAAVAALFVAMSAPAFAQGASPGSPLLGAKDWDSFTNTRINVVKAALQLTPDQEKYWPAIEKAMRARAEHRQTRIANAAQAMAEKGNGGLVEALRNRNPIEAMNNRADALAQRSTDLKNLADAWQPLYKTLKPEQKRRMAFLGIAVLHAVGSRVEQRRWQAEENEEE
jgi:LTXXQ motif family protein